MPRLKCSFGAITYIRVTRRNRKGTLGLVRLRLYEWWTNYGVTIRLRYKSKHSCGPHGTFILLRSEPSQPVNVCESMLSQIISLADLLNSQDLEWRFYSEHFPSYPHVSTHRLRRPNVASLNLPGAASPVSSRPPFNQALAFDPSLMLNLAHWARTLIQNRSVFLSAKERQRHHTISDCSPSQTTGDGFRSCGKSRQQPL